LAEEGSRKQKIEKKNVRNYIFHRHEEMHGRRNTISMTSSAAGVHNPSRIRNRWTDGWIGITHGILSIESKKKPADNKLFGSK